MNIISHIRERGSLFVQEVKKDCSVRIELIASVSVIVYLVASIISQIQGVPFINLSWNPSSVTAMCGLMGVTMVAFVKAIAFAAFFFVKKKSTQSVN